MAEPAKFQPPKNDSDKDKEKEEEKRPEPMQQSAPTGSGPKLGDIVQIRSSVAQSVPAIVVNANEDANAGGAVSLMAFLANPYDQAVPIKLVSDAQLETKDSPLDSLANDFYRWYRPLNDKGRDIVAELRQRDEENARKAQEESDAATRDREARERERAKI